MRRCVFVLAFASVAALGQEQPAMPSPNLNPNRAKAVENAVRNLFRMNRAPRGVVRFEPAPRRLVDPGPRERTCVVPLLEVPVDPEVDRKMTVLVPKSNVGPMPIAQGLPACVSNRLK